MFFNTKTHISFCLLLSFAVKIVFIDIIVVLAATINDIVFSYTNYHSTTIKGCLFVVCTLEYICFCLDNKKERVLVCLMGVAVASSVSMAAMGGGIVCVKVLW